MLELNTTSPYQELHAFLSIDSVLFDLLGQISPTKRREHMGLINKVDMECLSPVGYGV